MSTFSGKTAVITGAGSGIGRALALQLAADGARLALSDVNSVGLEETADQVRALGAEVHTAHLNVAEREAVLHYADEVAARFGTINMVFNNAGIAFTGDVEVSEFKDIERVIDVDFWGVVNGTKAFLPHLIASGDGHVVNISSLFGLVAIPSQSAYNAAKFAVRGFTEALRMEMITNKHPVAVTCVHPGGIKTAIARTATAAEGTDAASLGEFFDKHLARTSPEAAAKRILKDVRRKRARSLIGLDARALDIFQRTTGAGYERIFAVVAGRVMKKAGQVS
ncbi:SDR family NAD(P)-dependent oxidoreductase [Lolliginicoccus suaedae]|uniref:SDR family NAD(P)-dependent oxidoreductase n=1 Tax=Lolliginicoccus suaedae TaxID=2605429 RepID=UPI0011F03398|nr:SDR family NAD(P)-dependent oxidoreductase [Lolliginicoccus suaedae]